MKKLAVVAVAAAVAAMTTMAAAEVKKKPSQTSKHAAYTHSNQKSQRFDPNDPKCIEAEARDPSGANKAYPCWARAALSPEVRQP
jgi:hypothetical protein